MAEAQSSAATRTGIVDPPTVIVPSVLAADASRLGEECRALDEAGADRLQWDIMDGRFVPNITFGPDVVAACRGYTRLPFEAHLMIEQPDLILDRYVEAGCGLIIVHAESTRHLHRSLGRVHEAGARAGVALNPATPIDAIAHVLDLVDLVLVMTVNPGFGGQRYLPTMEPKLRAARAAVRATGRPIDIEVDGGIDADTVAGAAGAGANVFVAGTSVQRDPDGLAHAIAAIRSGAHDASRAWRTG